MAFARMRGAIEPRTEQPQEDAQLSSMAKSLGFTHVYNFAEGVYPCNLVSGVCDLGDFANGDVSTIAGPGGRGWKKGTFTGGHYEVSGNPFATSTCTYLWIESCPSVDTNGSSLVTTRYAALTTGEIGSLQIRITATDILVLRAQQALTLSASNARVAGRLNVCAVSVAGDNGRHAAFSSGSLIASATPTTTYTHGTPAIGNGPTLDLLRFDGPLYMLAFAPVVVSDEALASLTSNPWQLFAPRRILIPSAAAAAGLPTLSASTYKPGTLTSSGWTARVTAS